MIEIQIFNLILDRLVELEEMTVEMANEVKQLINESEQLPDVVIDVIQAVMDKMDELEGE